MQSGNPIAVLLWHCPARGMSSHDYEDHSDLMAVVRPTADLVAAHTYHVLGHDWAHGMPTYATWYITRDLSEIRYLSDAIQHALACSDLHMRHWRSAVLAHRSGGVVPPSCGYLTWVDDPEDFDRSPAFSAWEYLLAGPDDARFCRWDAHEPAGSGTGIPILHRGVERLSVTGK